MARKYVLDTNLHIDAIRNSLKEQALEGFLERDAPMTYMSAVVMQELRAGAGADEQAKVLQDGICDVFERRSRVVAPSTMAFKDCGRILATLFRQGGLPYKDRPRSLVNDILIAITCRENGLTLLTAGEDFKMIRPHLRGFAHAPPWPADANSRRATRGPRVKPT